MNQTQALANDLLALSQPVAAPDMVQGAGGNTSVKDAGLMVVKASGFELRQLAADEAWALVRHQPLRQWFQQADALISAPEAEAQFAELVKANSLQTESKSRRPSMETGFHAILENCVIHTHSVYANLVTCRAEGQELLQEIFGEESGLAWIPYIHPGYWLTLSIWRARQAAMAATGQAPRIYFLENHGLIAVGESVAEALALQHQVTQKLKNFFGTYQPYPYQDPAGEGNSWQSANPWLQTTLKEQATSADVLETEVLFPDQTIYFHSHVGGPGSGKKLELDAATGAVHYNCNFKEARTLEETLTAWAWVRQQIAQAGGQLSMLTPQHLAFLHNMESEKFRKAQLAGQQLKN